MAASSSSSVPSEITKETVTSQSEAAASSAAMVKLITSDKQIFEVEVAVAEQCETIQHMIEDGCADSLIPVTNVDAETLAKVLEWCKHHVAGGKASEEEVKRWENEFVVRDQDELYHMIMAANYLSVKPMLDRLAQRVADMIKGKHPTEIRKMFNIRNDFEPEEYDQIMKDNAWAFD